MNTATLLPHLSGYQSPESYLVNICHSVTWNEYPLWEGLARRWHISSKKKFSYSFPYQDLQDREEFVGWRSVSVPLTETLRDMHTAWTTPFLPTAPPNCTLPTPMKLTLLFYQSWSCSQLRLLSPQRPPPEHLPSPPKHSVLMTFWISVTETTRMTIYYRLILFPPQLNISFTRSGPINYSTVYLKYGAWPTVSQCLLNKRNASWMFIIKA